MGVERCSNCMAVGVGQGICPRCGYDNGKQNGTHQLPAGTVLNGQYFIGRVLGQGGFGITYRAWDSFLEIPVAIKEYFPTSFVNRTCAQSHEVRSYGGDAEARFEHNKRRFQKEVRALAKFRDVKEIVQVQSFFYANNTAYIVMEYVDGVDISGYMTRLGRALSMEETKRLLEPIVRAVALVHKEGLVHRDISPDNIMLLPDGAVKLLDFGAVRDLGTDGGGASTEAILKHGFAPIEQYVNTGEIGPWTDVYALCATMYYCVTGKIPTDAASRMMGEALPRFSELGIAVSPADEKAIRHGMELQPESRSKDVGQLRDELYADTIKQRKKQEQEQQRLEQERQREEQKRAKAQAKAEKQEKARAEAEAKAKAAAEARARAKAKAEAEAEAERQRQRTQEETDAEGEVKSKTKAPLWRIVAAVAVVAIIIVGAVVWKSAPPAPAPVEATTAPTPEPTPSPEELYVQAVELYDAEDYEAAAAILTDMEPLEYPAALSLLGDCYRKGEGVEKDTDRACALYKLALEKDGNDARAQTGMGWCCENGYGVEKDEAEAYRWFMLAAEQGYPEAQNNVGWDYMNGSGVEKDEAEGFRWFMLLAEQGDAYGQYQVGWCYHQGYGVEKDEAEAYRWFMLSAEQDNAVGQYMVGFCYQNGWSVERNAAEGFRWFVLSAEQGYDAGQYRVGMCYQQGQGVEEDDAEGFRWLMLSAEQGYSLAQKEVAECYENGIGVEQNADKAKEWYDKAKAQDSGAGEQ